MRKPIQILDVVCKIVDYYASFLKSVDFYACIFQNLDLIFENCGLLRVSLKNMDFYAYTYSNSGRRL